MKLVFSCIDNQIELNPGETAVLEVQNEALFSRLCLSILSGEGLLAVEPYSIWDGDSQVKPSSALLAISDPLNLPWDNRYLLTPIFSKIEAEFLADEDLRLEVSTAENTLREKLFSLCMNFETDFNFYKDWELKRYLKYLDFGIIYEQGDTYLDNLINFMSLVRDSKCDRVIVFFNLKTFLTESDLQELYEQVFFLKNKVLLLENKPDCHSYSHERKYTIDLDFIES